jgi:thiol-disulfide isomerase/thioredoxin
MRKPSRSFVVGCLTGTLLGTAGLVLCGVAVAFLFKDWIIETNAKRLRIPPITSGLEAVYDWQVTALDGTAFDLEATRGQTVVLNFWHPDCVPCLAEIPALNGLYDAVSPEGVVFVCVAVEDEEGLEAVVQREGIRFPVYRLQGKRPAVYATTITPATFIIDPLGEIVFKHEGAAKWDDESVAAYLRLQMQKAIPPSEAAP